MLGLTLSFWSYVWQMLKWYERCVDGMCLDSIEPSICSSLCSLLFSFPTLLYRLNSIIVTCGGGNTNRTNTIIILAIHSSIRLHIHRLAFFENASTRALRHFSHNFVFFSLLYFICSKNIGFEEKKKKTATKWFNN